LNGLNDVWFYIALLVYAKNNRPYPLGFLKVNAPNPLLTTTHATHRPDTPRYQAKLSSQHHSKTKRQPSPAHAAILRSWLPGAI